MGTYEKIRKEILKRVEIHPCCTEHLLDICPNKPVLYKLIAGLRKRKQIKYEIPLRGENGRPRFLWCQRLVNYPLHDKQLTDVLLKLKVKCERWDVDKDLRPDAELTVNEELYYLEMDMGTERGRAIEDRLSVYETVGNSVLWVVPDEKRMEQLMRKSPRSYFGIYKEILNGGGWNRDGVSYQLIT